MRSILKSYKKAGVFFENNIYFKRYEPMEGGPPVWQTPGRVQFYKAEMLMYLPEEEKWAVRQPTRYAVSEANLTYLPKVEEQVRVFIKDHAPINYFRPDHEVGMDTKISQLELLLNASSEVREAASSGRLRELQTALAEAEAEQQKAEESL